MDLKSTLQFGPHKIEVIGIFDKGEGNRIISAKCVSTCCSGVDAIQLSMPEKELNAIADIYNGQISTIKMKQAISKIIEEMRQQERPVQNVPLEEEIASPFNYQARLRKSLNISQ